MAARSIRRPQSERNRVHIISHHVRNVCYLIIQYGDKRRVKIAPSLWPFDTSERLVRCTVGQQRQVGNGSDAPACEGRAFLDGENRDGTARQIPSSNACQRSAAMTTTTAKTRSAARPQTPTRNLRTEGAGTPSSGGGRGSGCRQIRHHWAEGVATPFSMVAVAASTNTSPLDGRRSCPSSGGSGCQRILD